MCSELPGPEGKNEIECFLLFVNYYLLSISSYLKQLKL